MRYINGSTYEGFWKKDKKCGRGVMLWRDVDEIYTGDWKDNLPDGMGEYIWSEAGGSGSGNGNNTGNIHLVALGSRWSVGLVATQAR